MAEPAIEYFIRQYYLWNKNKFEREKSPDLYYHTGKAMVKFFN